MPKPDSTWVQELHLNSLAYTEQDLFRIHEILEADEIQTDKLLMQLDDLEEKHDELHNLNEQLKKHYDTYEWCLQAEEKAIAERDEDMKSKKNQERAAKLKEESLKHMKETKR